MSERTLYQKTDDHMHWTDSSDKCKHPGCDAVLMYGVPVERCEHGNIDSHWVQRITGFSSQGDLMYRKTGEWCPGAGIGGDDE